MASLPFARSPRAACEKKQKTLTGVCYAVIELCHQNLRTQTYFQSLEKERPEIRLRSQAVLLWLTKGEAINNVRRSVNQNNYK